MSEPYKYMLAGTEENPGVTLESGDPPKVHVAPWAMYAMQNVHALADHLGCDPKDLAELDLVKWHQMLTLIKSCQGQTLLGGRGEPSEIAHQIGANKAFEQCAEHAADALARLPEKKNG